VFLAAAPAALVWGKDGGVRVGCQANGFPLKAGDFPALLKALESMKGLGYTGFECNYRFVEGEFGRAAASRAAIERTGVRFIGAHANMAQIGGPQGARVATGVAALGADCIVMSGSGLSPEGRIEKPALLAKAGEMERLARLLKEHKLLLAYHNHNPEFANGNAEMEGLVENTSPELVHFLMDAGHGYLGGGPKAGNTAALGPDREHIRKLFGV
jgi:sugar phosphate isomerase/epimerase